jgi:hypothetical protein
MGKISCKCGHSFSDGQIPCSYQYNLIPDIKSEELTEGIINIVEKNDDVWVRVDYLISDTGLVTYKCPTCNGILIFWNGLENPAVYYKEED